MTEIPKTNSALEGEGVLLSQPCDRRADALSVGLDAEPSAAFTPGPWEELENMAGPMGVIALRVPPESSERICWIEITGRERANATLIAAAPDMLRALESIASGTFDGDLALGLAGRWDRVVVALQDLARAAIAKALASNPKEPGS